MNRRELIQASLSTAVVLGSAGAVFVEKLSASTDGNQHNRSTDNPLQRVINSAAACVQAGESCVAHCMSELANGNTEMANCNKRVHEMLASCNAMLKLASYHSEFATQLAGLCADICKACKEACAEHRTHWDHGMHLECKDCHDACIVCERECRAIAS